MIVAIVNCKKAADKNCMGSCLKTYAEGAHPGEQPGYYFHCGGCDTEPDKNEELAEKIRKMKGNGVRKIHFSSCVRADCPNRERLRKVFADSGMDTEFACPDAGAADSEKSVM